MLEVGLPLPLPEDEELADGVLLSLLDEGVELDEDELEDGVELVDDVGGLVVLDGGGVVVSVRGGLVGLVDGIVVPGGMYVPGGIGAPGGSTTGAWSEPGGGTIVTTGVPLGPTDTTAVGDVAGSDCATPLTVTVPGTALPWMTCGPDEEFAFPPLRSPAEVVDGVASSAIPPNAVASTTPLAASST
ncbi:hypothetical protein [Amycolatopsis alkalitolerans]|uniref:Uncharacterized protein n=1 Tax=Amycolatopsis alkalitolerans TaxID=2547244 RepID=A0A5C4LUL1_9PSEU|nr:hypothetical protein [Amycolatopsis alkalitolerans]TNC22464.1 hypothetical protein FG385_24925 [Amycolatopsis alkalitolerans]